MSIGTRVKVSITKPKTYARMEEAMTTSAATLIASDVWSGPKLLWGVLDGKKIAYSSETLFYVQVGRRAKGAYKNKAVIKGNLYRAANYYASINIGLGYKKRLVMAGKVLAKQCSS